MAETGSTTSGGLSWRRHVLYIEGYDPQGAEGYYKLFDHALRRFLKNWPVRAKAGPLQLDSDDFAHWDVAAAGPNWRVHTCYEFLRQERMIRANMAQPMWRQVPRALGLMFNYLYTGTLFRIYRASPQYGAALTYFQLLLILWLAASALGGWCVVWALQKFIALPSVVNVLVGALVAIGVFKLLRPLADKLFTVQINSHWPYLLRYGRGEPSCFDYFVEAGAQRLVEMVKAPGIDEIVVVGHSGGGVLGPAVVARALEIDPALGTHGPKVVLLTPGSLMPGIGLHRHATRVRNEVYRVAIEPSVLWIDVQARADVLNFFNFDPVAGIGIDAGAWRRNPLVWKVRIREMMSPEFYRKRRWDLFRMHYQFVMGNDRRAHYEYMMLVCGPLPVEEWAQDAVETFGRFDADGTCRAVAPQP
ncbi:alpha/beta fold hydrolase [Rhodoplanes sp. Z2-YC6860]|uniref:alpha/beta fold hydrolase n=1 Tax=Rhodoplanes sp. Z2-YC6860 TaxID=674703 RepID=UPI00078DC82B|nr:alpha/beta fold hydrolase [Rhodoplanes sp. Z2-YC6860]AMN45406.1 lipase [Rhodoplanes sp. Z2-YC6860]